MYCRCGRVDRKNENEKSMNTSKELERVMREMDDLKREKQTLEIESNSQAMMKAISDFQASHDSLLNIVHKAIAPMVSSYLNSMSSAIGSIKWQQYSPYFNDGEPCDFSANID